MNSVDSWKGPHTETGKAVARRRPRPCHRLSSLARPPSLSGGGGLLYHFSGCPGPPASLCRCHTPPHFFEGAHGLAPPTPGCHQEPVCSPGSGHRSRPTANNTHSVRWPGACELEPVLQRTQNPAAGASVLWVTSRRLSSRPHWWAARGRLGAGQRKGRELCAADPSGRCSSGSDLVTCEVTSLVRATDIRS